MRYFDFYGEVDIESEGEQIESEEGIERRMRMGVD